MDAELLIIGGGFWGSTVAWEARRRGVQAVLLDDGHPQGASRAAAGLSCESWFAVGAGTISSMLPDWWTIRTRQRAYKWLQEVAGGRKVGEWFTSRNNPTPRWRSDLWMVDSCQSVLRLADNAQHLTAKVSSLRRSPKGWWAVTEQGEMRARQVCVAAGAFTDVLLEASELPKANVKGLRGRALVLELTGEPPVPLAHTYLARPYTHYTLRPWRDGLARLGDSVERSASSNGLLDLQTVAERMAPGSRQVAVLDGLRPVCDRFHVELHAPGLVVATGGHRVGLAMSGVVAERVMDLLQ